MKYIFIGDNVIHIYQKNNLKHLNKMTLHIYIFCEYIVFNVIKITKQVLNNLLV